MGHLIKMNWGLDIGNSSANKVYFDVFAVRLEEARSVVGFTTPLMNIFNFASQHKDEI
jgi:hypothetical protein